MHNVFLQNRNESSTSTCLLRHDCASPKHLAITCPSTCKTIAIGLLAFSSLMERECHGPSYVFSFLENGVLTAFVSFINRTCQGPPCVTRLDSVRPALPRDGGAAAANVGTIVNNTVLHPPAAWYIPKPICSVAHVILSLQGCAFMRPSSSCRRPPMTPPKSRGTCFRRRTAPPAASTPSEVCSCMQHGSTEREVRKLSRDT